MSSRPPDGPLSSPRLRRSTREAADKSARAESRHARRTPIFAQCNHPKQTATHIHAGTSCDGKEAQGGHYWSGESTCPVAPDPWTGDYDAVWNSDEFGNASPYNVNPGSKLGPPPITGGPFTIGTDESTCGVTGHAVIVHKGCPSDRDDPCDPGVRIGCCVLA